MEYKTELLAFAVAAAISVVAGKIIIPLLSKLKAGQNVLSYVDKHAQKSGTTTMGGIIFAISTLICWFIFCREGGQMSMLAMIFALGYLIVGFCDDFIKIKSGRNLGLTVGQKLFFQISVALIAAVYVYFRGYTLFFIPFLNKFYDFKIWGALLVFFAFIATTNCVNLTDGLDGLAGGVSYIYLLLLAVTAFAQTKAFKNNFVSPEVMQNLARFAVIESGALVGFLIYNTYRATVFMGDTGSLYLGGFIAAVSIFSGNIFFIPLFGIMFVASGISVIVQVVHFKRTGRRVFLMSPLHHHLEYKGLSESKIVFSYKLITALVGIICIILIKGD